MDKLSVIHFGSYWMGVNDIVHEMVSDLTDICNVVEIDTEIYAGNTKNWFAVDASHNPNRPIHWLNDIKVMALVNEVRPDIIVVNSGGMSLRPDTVKRLRTKGIFVVGISLSDPDVFPDHGKIYSGLYDRFYTNSLYSLDNQYNVNKNARLLPFGASTKYHYPMDIPKEFDVVVVGHARQDRKKIVERLKTRFKVGTFGNGWGGADRSVHGKDHIRAINSGRIYLSFSGTVAGYTNVKVGHFEAAACNACIATEKFDEMERYFKYGIDILGYEDAADLLDLVGTYCEDARMRNWICRNSYGRFLKEHTWRRRWENVLSEFEYSNRRSV